MDEDALDMTERDLFCAGAEVPIMLALDRDRWTGFLEAMPSDEEDTEGDGEDGNSSDQKVVCVGGALNAGRGLIT